MASQTWKNKDFLSEKEKVIPKKGKNSDFIKKLLNSSKDKIKSVKNQTKTPTYKGLGSHHLHP